MLQRRKLLKLVLAAYLISIPFAYIRLPFAAIKNLSDYPLLRDKTSLSISADSEMSSRQRAYLKRSLNILDDKHPTQIASNPVWYYGIVARVRSGYRAPPESGEWLDCIYVSLFGAWIPVYRISHMIT
jgi:hypothetical protein